MNVRDLFYVSVIAEQPTTVRLTQPISAFVLH